jgi:hypothetical protein
MTLVATQTAAAMSPAILTSAEAAPMQQIAPAAPAPSDVVNAKRVFVENASGSPEIYSRFVADLAAWGRYTLVNSPAEADVVFAFHDEPLSVAIIEPSTQVVFTTVSASYVPSRRDPDQEATLAAQNLVSAIKQLVGAPLSAQETVQLTPPVEGKRAGLIVTIVILSSLAIAGAVVAVLHGRGH